MLAMNRTARLTEIRCPQCFLAVVQQIGGGLDTSLQHWTFGVGLKGVRTEEQAADVIRVVDECLAEVVAHGFPADAVNASLNTIEFQVTF